MRMLTVVDPTGAAAGVQAVVARAGAGAGQPGAGAVRTPARRCGLLRLGVGLLGIGQLALAVRFVPGGATSPARRLLRASLVYLPVAAGVADACAVGCDRIVWIAQNVSDMSEHCTRVITITITDTATCKLEYQPALPIPNGKLLPVAVPVDGNHVLRRADRHVHRAAVRGRRNLARAARRASCRKPSARSTRSC